MRENDGGSVYGAGLARLGLAVLLLAGLAASPDRGEARDLTLILDRLPDSVELYMTLPADRADDIFGLPQEALTGAAGVVDYDDLRQGTAPLGDRLIAGTSTTLAGRELGFEAMSLMVHPVTDPLPMTTPFEGLLSILVCTAPEPEVPPTLDALRMYAGYVAYVETAEAPFTFTLPRSATGPVDVTLREFRAGTFLTETEVTLAPGGTLTVFPGTPPEPASVVPVLLLLSGLCGVAAMGLAAGPGLRRRWEARGA